MRNIARSLPATHVARQLRAVFPALILAALVAAPGPVRAQEDRRPVIRVKTTFQNKGSLLALTLGELLGPGASLEKTEAQVSRMTIEVLGKARPIFNFVLGEQARGESLLTLTFKNDDAWPDSETGLQLTLATADARTPVILDVTLAPPVDAVHGSKPQELAKELKRTLENKLGMSTGADVFSVVPFPGAGVKRLAEGEIETALTPENMGFRPLIDLAVFRVEVEHVNDLLLFRSCGSRVLAGRFTTDAAVKCGELTKLDTRKFWPKHVQPSAASILYLQYWGGR